MTMGRYEDILWYSLGEDVKEATIFPLSDVHLGAQGSEAMAFYKLVGEIAKAPNTYVTLQGDLIDNGTRNSVTNIFRATMPPSQQKREMAKALEPIRDKILCILPGNHERRSGKDADDDPCYDIAAKLDLEDRYREDMAFVRIALGRRIGGNQKPLSYLLACVHGAGGGALPGSGINRADKFMQAMDGVDVFIHGHTHRPYCLRGSKIVIDVANKRVTRRPTLTMCAGAWLGYVGYPVEKMLTPTAEAGANKLLLSGTKFRFEAVI
jgi:predicted phosphodiesterase